MEPLTSIHPAKHHAGTSVSMSTYGVTFLCSSGLESAIDYIMCMLYLHMCSSSVRLSSQATKCNILSPHCAKPAQLSQQVMGPRIATDRLIK
jgi:hypothetical protein